MEGQKIEKGTSKNIVLSSFCSWTKITGQHEQVYCHPFYSKNPHGHPSVMKGREKLGGFRTMAQYESPNSIKNKFEKIGIQANVIYSLD